MQDARTDNFARRLRIAAAVVLFAGLAASALIYLTAAEDPGDAIGYVIVDGRAYPVRPEDSKLYRHNLEQYGGKMSVVMDGLIRDFSGLWRGRRLAFTTAVLTVLLSGGIFLGARHAHVLAALTEPQGEEGTGLQKRGMKGE